MNTSGWEIHIAHNKYNPLLKYYVTRKGRGGEEDVYLHRDGTIHQSTRNPYESIKGWTENEAEYNSYTGYYKTAMLAQEAIERYEAKMEWQVCDWGESNHKSTNLSSMMNFYVVKTDENGDDWYLHRDGTVHRHCTKHQEENLIVGAIRDHFSSAQEKYDRYTGWFNTREEVETAFELYRRNNMEIKIREPKFVQRTLYYQDLTTDELYIKSCTGRHNHTAVYNLTSLQTGERYFHTSRQIEEFDAAVSADFRCLPVGARIEMTL